MAVLHEPSNTYARDFRPTRGVSSIDPFRSVRGPCFSGGGARPGRAVARRLQKCPPLPDFFFVKGQREARSGGSVVRDTKGGS